MIMKNKISFFDIIYITKEQIKEENFTNAFACIRCLKCCAIQKSKEFDEGDDRLNHPGNSLFIEELEEIDSLITTIEVENQQIRGENMEINGYKRKLLEKQLEILILLINDCIF